MKLWAKQKILFPVKWNYKTSNISVTVYAYIFPPKSHKTCFNSSQKNGICVLYLPSSPLQWELMNNASTKKQNNDELRYDFMDSLAASQTKRQRTVFDKLKKKYE